MQSPLFSTHFVNRKIIEELEDRYLKIIFKIVSIQIFSMLFDLTSDSNTRMDIIVKLLFFLVMVINRIGFAVR